jgi:hypothetical protein
MNTVIKKINFSSLRNFNLSKSKIILNTHNFNSRNFSASNFNSRNFSTSNFNFKTSKLGSVKKLGTRTFTIKKSTAGRKKFSYNKFFNSFEFRELSNICFKWIFYITAIVMFLRCQ